jgi:nitrogen regulatory protein P-II 1
MAKKDIRWNKQHALAGGFSPQHANNGRWGPRRRVRRLREITKENMTKLEAVIQPSKLDAVKEALLAIGIDGLTVLEVRGHGRQKGHTEFYRGREYSVDLLPKIKLEIVLRDEVVDEVIKAIIGSAHTGKIGDGKIFISRIDEAIRIRNEERGTDAL